MLRRWRTTSSCLPREAVRSGENKKRGEEEEEEEEEGTSAENFGRKESSQNLKSKCMYQEYGVKMKYKVKRQSGGGSRKDLLSVWGGGGGARERERV